MAASYLVVMRAVRPWSGRQVFVYALCVALPALALVGFGLKAAQQEREAVRVLTETNKQLAGERLDAEMERGILERVDTCLRQTEPLQLERNPPGCEIAESFFLLEDGVLRYPPKPSALAERLAKDLRYPPPLRPGKVYSFAYRTEPVAQIFYLALPSSGNSRILAMSTRLDFIASDTFLTASFLAQVRAKLLNREGLMDAPPQGTFFRTLFPFWKFEVAPPSHGALLTLASPLSAGLMVATGCMLLISVVLLVRDGFRQRELVRQRADLVSGFSHELKMPLQLIQVCIDVLSGAADEETRRKYWQVLFAQKEQLARQVDKVLGAGQIEKYGRTYQLEPGNLTEAVRRATEVDRLWLPHQGYTLETEIADSPALVRFDEEAVAEAVSNLLENAVKYSGISRKVRLRLSYREEAAVLEVSDSGIGIPRSEQEHIFEPFYRLPGKTGKGGFGLGLYLVRHIMEGHGGRVELESEVGRGSTFRLIFPLLCEQS